MRDSTEFKNWKLKNDEKEKIEELEHQQKSIIVLISIKNINIEKIEMELAREAAAKAVEEKTIENKNLVSEMKEIV